MNKIVAKPDFEAMENALLRAISGAEEIRFDEAMSFQLWSLSLLDVFKPAAARVIGMLHMMVAEQEMTIGNLAARVADLETALDRRTQHYDTRSISGMVAWVSRELRISAVDIRSERRDKHAVNARQAIAWAARHAFEFSYPRIARSLGRRDHTTIMTAVRRAEMRRKGDDEFRDLTDRLLAQFRKEKHDADEIDGFDAPLRS